MNSRTHALHLVLFIVGWASPLTAQPVTVFPFENAAKLGGYVIVDSQVEAFDFVNHRTAITDILSTYIPSLDSTSTREEVLDYFTDKKPNPFLAPLINNAGGTTASTDSTDGVMRSNADGFSAFKAIGGLNVTRLADGLARFLVERTKHELTVTFFQTFRDRLKDEQYADLKMLFRETHSMLGIVGDEIYNYRPYLAALRDAFQRDLRALFERVPLVLNNHPDWSKTHPEYHDMVTSSLSLVRQLGTGTHPGDMLNHTSQSARLESIDPNLASAVRVTNIFSQALKSSEAGRYWISPDVLHQLHGATLRIFLGLVYHQTPDSLIFVGTDTFNFKQDIFRPLADKQEEMVRIGQFVSDFIDRTGIVRAYLQDISATEDQKTIQYFELFDAVLDLLAFATEAPTTWKIELNETYANHAARWLRIGRSSSNLYLDVKRKQYTLAVLDAATLLKAVLGDHFNSQKPLIKYGSFMAAVAEAENSVEIQEAIETIALPPGSASIKRQSKRNIALNAYVGLAAGNESLEGNSKFVTAVNAPVGLAYSWGHYKLKASEEGYDEMGAVTLFFSLIDLGAITAFRFGDGETEALPKIHLQNIFSPGVHFVYGLPKYPFSIGAGAQLGPAIRSVSGDDLTLRNGVNWRFHVFFSVDIPLLNFHTTSR